MVVLFLVAAGVTAAAVPAAIVLGGRPRMLSAEAGASEPAGAGGGGDDTDGAEGGDGAEREPVTVV
jgi:hypothetical protein